MNLRWCTVDADIERHVAATSLEPKAVNAGVVVQFKGDDVWRWSAHEQLIVCFELDQSHIGELRGRGDGAAEDLAGTTPICFVLIMGDPELESVAVMP